MEPRRTISYIPQSPRRTLLLALLLMAFGMADMGVMQYLATGVAGFPLDDAYIHGVFARNIAQGHFFHYNIGQPVAGSTSPLWTLVLAGLYALGFSAVPAAWFAGLGLTAILVWLMYRTAMLMGMERPFGVAAALLTALSPRVLWSAASGMEVSLVMVLCLAAVYASLRFAHYRGWQRILPPVLFGLAIGARPECAALFPVALAWLAWDYAQRPREERPAFSGLIMQAGIWILVWLCVAALWAALNYHLSGRPLPLTFYVKTAQQGLGHIIAAGDWAQLAHRLFVQAPLGYGTLVTWLLGQDMAPGLLLFPLLGYRLWQSARQRKPLPLWALPLLLLLAYPYIRGVITGQYHHYGQFARYLAVLTPLYLLLVTVGLHESRAWLDRHENRTLMIWLAVAAVVVAFGWYRYAIQPGYQWIGRSLPSLQAASLVYLAAFVVISLVMLGIRQVLNRRHLYLPLWQLLLAFGLLFSVVELPQWAAENAVAVGNVQQGPIRIAKVLQAHGVTDPIATCDVGAIAFYNNAPVLAIIGLVTPSIARLWTTGYTEETLLKTLLDQPQRPGWLATYQPWNPWLIATLLKMKWAEVAFIAPIENNITCGPLGVPNMALLRLTIPPDASMDMIH